MVTGRALHFVFKIPDRKLTAKFYREILGMKVLRHEEFSEGCDAACNGPYANRWSKTMIGYGPEDTHFVIELTYNYGIKEYEAGNDFRGITIRSKEVIERARAKEWPIKEESGKFVLQAPGGYKYYIIDEQQPMDKDPVQKVTLSSSNLQKTIAYWKDILDLKVFNQTDKSVLLGYNENQAKVEFEDIGTEVNHAKAYGRIAFSVPKAEQPEIQKRINESGNKILTDLITLDTPGKASVTVIILADPDGHEICFVDDEGFRQLSVPDYPSEQILDRYIKKET
ncbi:glyoxalase domain-containing protein 4 isoform X1 [Hylaeus anthracinus]|uniref:glyoxalase domain-containing protein 4 isoform X1 n=1 Tax=Hylaeus anthracinus TaxID=313031 RepID=UPI0023B91906|nr:glyoxalase domain-containing protein 4 isoform X1 [Hylaeus anthracinus]XP_054014103.1 glyoxalase domain-containing protein 4 isoform X1 [Hylaeus anthracinus]XP_054014104.1 glyoxalase domain-containing protein 4 isoform X1 [Hylaeus anthracinus]